MKDFYFVYFPIGEDFIQTMAVTFKHVPKDTNIIVVSNHPELINKLDVDFNLIVLNVDDLRDDWSKENETLIYDIEVQSYRDRFFEFQKNGTRFPYALHRCIIPWLVERNITKFAILDADCLINFNQEVELVMTAMEDYCKDDQFIFGPVMHWNSHKDEFLNVSSDILTKYNIPLSVVESVPELYIVFDGFLRGFWFNNTQDVILFYQLWDEILKEAYNKNSNLFYYFVINFLAKVPLFILIYNNNPGMKHCDIIFSVLIVLIYILYIKAVGDDILCVYRDLLLFIINKEEGREGPFYKYYNIIVR